MPTTGFEPKLFEKDDIDNWKMYLENEGFVVIKNVLTETELNAGLDIFKEDMKMVSPNFDMNNSSKLNINTCPIMYGKGMAIFNGFGQSNFMWHLRTNPQIQDIYKHVYDDDDLVVSMDGFSMFVSSEQKSKSWLHIDQNPKNSLYSIQGSFNYLPVASNKDSGFVVVPKSHKTYKPKINTNKDWFVCENQPIEESRKLIIPENCLTLWNSRTIHANEGIFKPGTSFNRLTCYVTFQPKKFRKEKIKKKRVIAYLKGETTSHWANRCELKRYPFGFKSRYEARGFGKIIPKLEDEYEDGKLKKKIPNERLILL